MPNLGQVLRVRARHLKNAPCAHSLAWPVQDISLATRHEPRRDCPVAGGFKDADHQNDAEVQSAAEFAAKEVVHQANA